MLCKKLKRAEEGYRDASKDYLEYSEYIGQKKQDEYEELHRKAQKERGKSLEIYTLSSQKGELFHFPQLYLTHLCQLHHRLKFSRKVQVKNPKEMESQALWHGFCRGPVFNSLSE